MKTTFQIDRKSNFGFVRSEFTMQAETRWEEHFLWKLCLDFRHLPENIDEEDMGLIYASEEPTEEQHTSMTLPQLTLTGLLYDYNEWSKS